jgi:hypothetical protein
MPSAASRQAIPDAATFIMETAHISEWRSEQVAPNDASKSADRNKRRREKFQFAPPSEDF